MRLRVIPDETNFDFFRFERVALIGSVLAILASIVLFFMLGLNFGIDFRGGTTIRTESSQPLDVGVYRQALAPLDLGDLAITEVFDPTFDADQHVAQIRIGSQGTGDAAITPETMTEVETALRAVDPAVTFASVESVGPKVSGELVFEAVLAVVAAIVATVIYIWLRFEWQFALGAVLSLIHDVMLTIGVFALFQIKFDLAIIAALLTIVGYSLNDTVVVFDRQRENLQKYKKRPLREVLNLAINETLSRTFMTSFTTLIALFALFALGGDVIRGFVFAMIWGIFVGTYSSVYIASQLVLHLGVKRDWSKVAPGEGKGGTQFGKTDA